MTMVFFGHVLSKIIVSGPYCMTTLEHLYRTHTIALSVQIVDLHILKFKNLKVKLIGRSKLTQFRYHRKEVA